jgi:prepilin-type N-terminal cleavage/methylation domain-containing protein
MLRYINKKVKNRKGFTLIELIIVVAILGAIAAIAVPSYQGYQKDAKINTNKANLATIQNAVWVFQADNGYLPDDHTDIEDAKYLGKPAPLPVEVDDDGDFGADAGDIFIMDEETGVVKIGASGTDGHVDLNDVD